jgi:23S rRNA pseudouridine1911/1915/1917 synthase
LEAHFRFKKQYNKIMEIILQAQNLIVANKPAGLKVYDSSKEDSMMERLIRNFPDLVSVGVAPRYGLIHRLDKETSGVVLIARNQLSLDYYQKEFRERRVTKTYLGLVHRQINPPQGIIESYLKRSPKDFRKQKAQPFSLFSSGRIAKTFYRTQKTFYGFTLLEIQPKTGRMHQIRVHMAWKNHPLAGDPLYFFKGQKKPDCLQRMFLHSFSLKINMPDQGIKCFQAELPKELQEVINCLSK